MTLNPTLPTHPVLDSEPAADLLQEGDLLAGKYRIEQLLGEGGMGVVFGARHIHIEQRVAIKFIRPESARDPSAIARFLREARLASAIKSEHVARVLDVALLDTGEPYLVMELLAGSDLGDLVRSQGALPVEDAVDYVLQACEALAEAHALGIVHRDLKPSNLFLTSREDGSPLIKILDFGLSKALQAEAPSLHVDVTATGEIFGSPSYMSPEQIRGIKDIDARTDVWSLGAILHKLLTTHAPFQGDAPVATVAQIVADPPARLRDQRPDAPASLEALLLRCLAKNRLKRVQDVAELAVALKPFASTRGRLSVERILPAVGRRGGGRSPSAAALPRGEEATEDDFSSSGSRMALKVPARSSAGARRRVAVAITTASAAFASAMLVALLSHPAARRVLLRPAMGESLDLLSAVFTRGTIAVAETDPAGSAGAMGPGKPLTPAGLTGFAAPAPPAAAPPPPAPRQAH